MRETADKQNAKLNLDRCNNVSRSRPGAVQLNVE